MAADIVLEPSSLFIANSDWEKEESRAEFLSTLMEMLSAIDRLKSNKILWSDDIEALLWMSPNFNPWNHYSEREYHQILPILYHKLNPHRRILFPTQHCCTFDVSINSIEGGGNLIDRFLELCNCAVNEEIAFNILFGKQNLNMDIITITSNRGVSYSSKAFYSKLDYYKNIKFEVEYWPASVDQHESQKLDICLSSTLELEFPDKRILYRYVFKKEFLRDILYCDLDRRRKLLSQMVKRLTLTNQQAGSDPTLQDEYIQQQEERRFRVTQRPTSIRVHYIFNQSKEIVVLKYYGAGEHDDGL